MSRALSGGAILSCPLAGCGQGPKVLSKAESSPYAIAVDADTIYWTDRGNNTIRKLAR
jgi:hypothetical protein